jgi:3-hydroxy-9,10-secoandrosta-1,3,5(10)-triene-9,17-dione monooxygenase reductase component
VSGADVDPAKFRQLLGRFATGVVVITAGDAHGRLAGMTANSLASVSLEPPLVSICVEHQAEMFHVMSDTDQFAINILSSHQETVSRRFAGGGQEDRFDGVGYQVSPRGLFILEGVLAYIECQKFAQHPLGDHTLFVARVTGGSASEDPAHSRPLLYYRGGYAGLSPG